MKYYSVMKRNDILIHVTTQINLEDIRLNEISQTQKEKYCMTPFIYAIFIYAISRIDQNKKKNRPFKEKK